MLTKAKARDVELATTQRVGHQSLAKRLSLRSPRTAVLQEIICYLSEHSKTPKPSRFSGFSLCLNFRLGANLVQVILKGL
ncbi:MAG: hypothetical protein E7467_08955 [Ruminococcaceae bacterium]|nr:hypothetical protein [Oscillospiraceae bacterium]